MPSKTILISITSAPLLNIYDVVTRGTHGMVYMECNEAKR